MGITHARRVAAAIAALVVVPVLAASPVVARVDATVSARSIEVGAEFSTAPSDGSAVPGLQYSDTHIAVVSGPVLVDGTEDVVNVAYLSTYTYGYDGNGEMVVTNVVYGTAEGADLDLAWHRSLADATLTATFATKTCPAVPGQPCVGGTSAVTAHWTATGPLVRDERQQHHLLVSQLYVENGRQIGVSRTATAAGTWDSVDLGASQRAYLHYTSGAFRLVCLGPTGGTVSGTYDC